MCNFHRVHLKNMIVRWLVSESGRSRTLLLLH